MKLEVLPDAESVARRAAELVAAEARAAVAERGRFAFAGARVREAGGLEITVNVIVDIEGNDRPALVAEWLFLAVREAAA